MDTQNAAVKPTPLPLRAPAFEQPPAEHINKTVVKIAGRIAGLVATDTGYRFELLKAAIDAYSHPSVYPIFSKVNPGKDGDEVAIWCEIVTFTRKAEDKRGRSMTFRDVRLFALQ